MLFTLIFKGTSVLICFNVKLDMNVYMYIFLVLMSIIISKLRDYIIVGQNQPQTLKNHSCQKMISMYITHFTTLLPVLKIMKLYLYTRDTSGNIIG